MQEEDIASFGLQTLWLLSGSGSGQCFGQRTEEKGEDEEEAKLVHQVPKVIKFIKLNSNFKNFTNFKNFLPDKWLQDIYPGQLLCKPSMSGIFEAEIWKNYPELPKEI